eukprot:10079838-Prorocentrum_lima.AAC.1
MVSRIGKWMCAPVLVVCLVRNGAKEWLRIPALAVWLAQSELAVVRGPSPAVLVLCDLRLRFA